MIKVCIFNKSNNVSRFDIFKTFFECVNSKISLTCCTETDAVYQNVLDHSMWFHLETQPLGMRTFLHNYRILSLGFLLYRKR